MIIYSLTLFVFQLELPVLAPTPAPSVTTQVLDTIGRIATPAAVLLLFVNLAYFWWHSKNREELTKAEAEAKSLAATRGEKIKDLESDIAKRDALILLKNTEIAAMELMDEKRAKIEFRLRGEIAQLEKRLGIDPDAPA